MNTIIYYIDIIIATTTIPSIPIKIDEEKENKLINKFQEFRQFKVNWSERDKDGWINYRWKNYDEIIIPMAIKSNILYYTDEDRVNVSFTGKFIRFLTGPDKDRVRRTNSIIINQDH